MFLNGDLEEDGDFKRTRINEENSFVILTRACMESRAWNSKFNQFLKNTCNFLQCLANPCIYSGTIDNNMVI